MKVILKHKSHDFPKKAGELRLAWYGGGQVCIARRHVERKSQKQNESIIRINRICKTLWDELDMHYKKDLAVYAKAYKMEYPSLRKRGVSSYAVFLMIIHALIKRFSLATDNYELCLNQLRDLLGRLTLHKAVQVRLLKAVRKHYLLNNYPFFHLKLSYTNPAHRELQKVEDIREDLFCCVGYG